LADSPQQQGRGFEKDFAEAFGAELQPGSGNQWYAKLDVRGREILWSLKHTTGKSITITRKILREAIQEATKIGSQGAIPGIAADVENEIFIVMRAQDFAMILAEDIRIVTAERAEVKRARAMTPLALRREEEDESGLAE
jgi:hypothetical protein